MLTRSLGGHFFALSNTGCLCALARSTVAHDWPAMGATEKGAKALIASLARTIKA